MADTSITLPPVTITGKREAISYKVMIKGGGGLVRFETSAPISESRVANYEGFNIVHLPTSLWTYRNTNGRHFAITGKLVSRTIGEATANAGYLTTIRSWLLPNFGSTGSTPPILFLTAYSNRKINSVPCVLLSYNWQFPDEVDYIFGAPEPMPVIGIITIELEEVYSADQITAGDWAIDPQSGGEFSYVGTPGSANSDGSDTSDESDTSESPPSYGPGFTGIAGSDQLPTLGAMLTPSSIAPSSITKLPTMVTQGLKNSPSLSSNAPDVKPLTFEVPYSNTDNTSIYKSVSNPAPWVSSNGPPDSFGRKSPFKSGGGGDYGGGGANGTPWT